ncbi:MAG: hypothetical protein MJ198_06330 [Bacteroidales bacterium]|nr:hypothetical protein [Bacteroidales bacterium]
MKRLMTILAIVFSTVQIFASELIVKGKIDVPFSVYINGQKYYSYKSQVNITNLPKGTYNMKIYTENARPDLLYNCKITIQKNSKVTATFTGENKIYISTTKDMNPRVIHVTPYPYHSNVPQKATPKHYEQHSVPNHNDKHNVTPAKPQKAEPAKQQNTAHREKAGTNGTTDVRKTNNTETKSPGQQATPRSTPATRKN